MSLRQDKIQGDVAIVGMACVFPKAPDVKTFWENIVSKVDAIDDPPEYWMAERFYDPNSKAHDRVYCKRGGYLGNLARFDPLEHGIMPVAVDGAEPEHFMALRVAHEALVDAGFPERPLNKEKTEVILGRGTFVNRGYMTVFQHGFAVEQTLDILSELHPEYSRKELETIKTKLKAGLPPFNAETAPGLAHNVMAGIIANRLDLNGANFVLDAACASCLIALEIGIRDLLSGKCDAVLTGGVQISTNIPIYMIFTQLGALSRRPELRPFDKGADGTMLGEGIGMVVLKRLEDAERDGHRIYAIIKGIGTSSDGRAKGILAPRVEGEELALRRAYENAGISADTVGLIEAHGTSIPLGDVTEIQSLRRVFGERGGGPPRCAVGSVKSMIGHLIPASGIAGIIKTALALYHKTLPPTLHCEEPNPNLEIEKTPFYINTETRPWIHGLPDTPRRAGVNAFGFGGINAHAILEEYVGVEGPTNEYYMHTWDTELCIFSGESRKDLIEQCKKIYAFISSAQDITLKDLAYTVNSLMDSKPYQLAIVGASINELGKKLEYAIKKLQDPTCLKIKDKSGIYFFEQPLAQRGKLAFLFPGEGSQYVNMLSDLCIHFPEVRHCFDLLDLAYSGHSRDFLPSQIIFPAPKGAEDYISRSGDMLWRMDVAVDAVIAADRALFRLLNHLEIKPHAVLGHSSGEFMALEAAGTFDVSDDKKLIQHIINGNKLIERMSGTPEIEEFLLVAVGAGDKKVLSDIIDESAGKILIAMDNCINQVVICGEKKLMDSAVDRLKETGAICQTLPFSRPYHTAMFKQGREALRDYFRNIEVVPPKIEVYSCVTAKPIPFDAEAVSRLAVEQWAAPVRFRETIESMYRDGINIFLEVGPKSNLTGFVKDILRGKEHLSVASNVNTRSGITQLNHVLGLLAAHGVAMNLDTLYKRRMPEILEMEVAHETAVTKRSKKNLPILRLDLPTLSLNKGAKGYNKRFSFIKEIQIPDLDGRQSEKEIRVTASVKKDHDFSKVKAGGQSITMPASALQDSIAPRSNRNKRKIMDEYLKTMEQFLSSQEKVMQSYLARVASPVVPSKKKVSDADNKFFDTSMPLPFVGEIIYIEKGSEIVSVRRLNIEKDLFLQHHTLGGKVSKTDKSLLALPIMPFSMSLEIMAETASQLMPQKLLTGIQNVRSNSWISLEEESITIETTARVISDSKKDKVYVQLRVATPGTPDAEARIAMEGTMVFGDKYPEAGPMSAFPLKSEKKPGLSPEDFYPKALFHGSPLQCVKTLDRIGNDGIEATLEVPERKGLFEGISDPYFMADPVILDGVGQVVGLWASCYLDNGFVIFPISLEELEFNAQPPGPYSQLKCQIRTALDGESYIHSDIQTAGTAGLLHMRIKGLRHKRIYMPKILHLVRGSRDVMLSIPWQKPLECFSSNMTIECCKIDQITAGFFEKDSFIWRMMLAFIVLSRRERELWRNMQVSEKRKTEWLLARTAGKDAVRLLLRKCYGADFWPADIEILSDEYGKPVVKIDSSVYSDQMPLLSLSHKKGISIAMAVYGKTCSGIGIDIELFQPLSRGFENLAFSSKEQSLILMLKEADALEWTLRIWCAKESVGKALGRGLIGALRDITANEIDISRGVISLGVSSKMAREFPELNGKILQSNTLRDGDLILASTIL